MKFLLKLICAPVMIVLWVATGMCKFFLQVSSLILTLIAVLLALASIIKLVDGYTTSGIIGLVVSFLLSPYGIPILATLILARFYCFRIWLKDVVYC